MPDSLDTNSVSEQNASSARREPGVADILCEFASKSLTRLIRNMLDKADDTLFQYSSNADTNQAQHAYLDAMREVRLKRHHIEHGFVRSINEAFKIFQRHKSLASYRGSEKTNSNDKLELIEDESVEINIAIQNMVEKLQRQCPREIYEVKSRVKAVFTCKNDEIENHPLSPATIANAFGDALSPLEIEFHVQLIIFKLFDKFVMGSIGGFYREINTLLINHKVLPDLRYSYKRSHASQSHARRNRYISSVPEETLEGHDWETVGPVSAFDNHPAATDIRQPSNYTAHTLMPTNFGLQGFSPTPVKKTGVIDTLTAMQSYINQEGLPEDLSPLAMGKQIISGIQRMGYPSVQGEPEQDNQVINLVSMIFDYILEDKLLSQDIKDQLNKLQVPYLKLALLDNSFLKNDGHTARQLIDKIAKASLGMESSRSKENFSKKIQTIVASILDNYEYDAGIFDKLHHEFSEYLRKEYHNNLKFEERAWKSAEGKERIEFVKRRVDAWIHMWCSREDAREQVKIFLDQHWKYTLVYCMHRYGEESREWRFYTKIINALIWSTTPGKSKEEVKRLIALIPLLIRGLSRGLNAVGTNQRTISDMFSEFSKYHQEIIEEGLIDSAKDQYETGPDDNCSDSSIGPTGNAATSGHNITNNLYQSAFESHDEEKSALKVDEKLESFVRQVPEESPQPDPIAYAEENIPEDEYYEQASNLKYGDWLMFEVNGKSVPAKLAWKSTLSMDHLFVGHDGSRVAMKSLAEIADELRSGQACRVEQESAFDRALRLIRNAGSKSDEATTA